MGIFSFLSKKEAKPPAPISDIPELTFPEIPGPKEEKPIEAVPEELPDVSSIEIPELPEIPEAPGVVPDLEEMAPDEMPPELSEFRAVSAVKSKSLFVNVDDYRELMEQLNKAKSVLSEYANFSARLNELKVSKENAYEKWRNALEAIERKLLYIDKIIFEGG